MESDWYLIVLAPEAEPYEWPLGEESVVVGRSRSSTLCIADRFLSRRHSLISFRDGLYQIDDLGSRNGTLVNGQAIQGRTALQHGDLIRLSGTTLTVVERARGEPEPSESSVSRQEVSTLDLLATPDPSPSPARRQSQSERLQLLHEIHHALGRSIALEELFEMILDRIFVLLKPEDAVIYLRGEGTDFEAVAHRSSQKGPTPCTPSRHLLHEVVERRGAVLVLDTRRDHRFLGAESLWRTGVRSLMAAPLRVPQRVFGMIVVSSRAKLRTFTQDDLDLLLDLASVAALRVDNALLAQDAAEHQRMEEELALARRIQERLLPEQAPSLEGYRLHASNTPSRGVSGDLYGWHEREGDEVELLVADVSGKGIGAALLTASLEALVAGPIEVGHPPDEICRRLSRRLLDRTPAEKFATVFLARLQPSSGWLTYCSAGHNPALVLRADGRIDLLEPTGIPVGLFPGATYDTGTCELHPGETLLVYTDGIVEAENLLEEEYGLERLQEACRGRHRESPNQLAHALEAHLVDFTGDVPFADDRTLLILRRDEPS